MSVSFGHVRIVCTRIFIIVEVLRVFVSVVVTYLFFLYWLVCTLIVNACILGVGVCVVLFVAFVVVVGFVCVVRSVCARIFLIFVPIQCV